MSDFTVVPQTDPAPDTIEINGTVYAKVNIERTGIVARPAHAILDMIDAAEEFVRRVESGEVRSKRTYSRFKKALDALALAHHEAAQFVDVPLPCSSSALRHVIAERRRQIEVEGFTLENDDLLVHHELARAATCYADVAGRMTHMQFEEIWPFSLKWWKPYEKRRELVKAAALLIAEIERIDRAESKKS